MPMKFDKYQTAFLKRTLDMRKTGGPLIPKGTQVFVLIRRKDGRLWCNIPDFGKRHLMPEDLSGYTQNKLTMFLSPKDVEVLFEACQCRLTDLNESGGGLFPRRANEDRERLERLMAYMIKD